MWWCETIIIWESCNDNVDMSDDDDSIHKKMSVETSGGSTTMNLGIILCKHWRLY